VLSLRAVGEAALPAVGEAAMRTAEAAGTFRATVELDVAIRIELPFRFFRRASHGTSYRNAISIPFGPCRAVNSAGVEAQ
jgi:hypothetical protein